MNEAKTNSDSDTLSLWQMVLDHINKCPDPDCRMCKLSQEAHRLRSDRLEAGVHLATLARQEQEQSRRERYLDDD